MHNFHMTFTDFQLMSFIQCVCVVMVSKECSHQSGVSPKNRKKLWTLSISFEDLSRSKPMVLFSCCWCHFSPNQLVLSQIMANHLIFRYIWSTRPGKPTKSYWSHGPVESSWIFPAIKWWIFPVRFLLMFPTESIEPCGSGSLHGSQQFCLGNDFLFGLASRADYGATKRGLTSWDF